MVTVEAGTERYQFEADAWSINEKDFLHVVNGPALVASFAPGQWEQVWKTESAK